jgi:hypothetical protein
MNVEMERGEWNSDTSNLACFFEVRKPAESSMGGPKRRFHKTGFMTFPERLFGFLECEEFRDTIWWNSDGDTFGIDPKGFAEKVLKKHCNGMKFESFRKSLSRWGFNRHIDTASRENISCVPVMCTSSV